MNILKTVFKNEVFPALGCTEPIAVAYAASIAAKELGDEIEEIRIAVDPGVYKNGMAVTVPNTGGERGNLIAGVLGALIRKPELKMQILKNVEAEMIRRATELIQTNKAKIVCDKSKTDLYIEVLLKTSQDSARAIIESGHTNLVYLEKNNTPIFQKDAETEQSNDKDYKRYLKDMSISDLADLAENMDTEDYEYVRQGVDMNLKLSEAGQSLKKVSHYLSDLKKKGYLAEGIFSSTEIMTASATDARMAGMDFPAMASGGSGNQGIVATLVPYNVGKFFEIGEKKIIQSIALSHLINSYIKCFTGDLSPLCGCAIAAGVGAAVAIVYQQKGKDMEKITLAVNNLISDIGGMLCDGAKGGCALKVVSSSDSAIRSAYMALNDHGITEKEGFVGKTAEETIYNLSRVSEIGMQKADDTMLGIMMAKNR
ncbi:MAG: hypothetical protein B6245_13735 [Desulfobacteraceae bacterium 4572_88]|nr:MAG: hypothetical protein B6245_13735 [Desulfobacteraceae bacterium 4572_88]